VWLGALTAGAESAEPRWFAGTLRVSTGFDWSTGSYGSSPDTTILYVPSTISYRWERFPVTATPLDELELRVTVPYLRVDGPGVIIDQGSVVPPGFDAATREGIGDVVVRATWRLLPRANSRLPMFELGGRLKVPTADRDLGLGTGELDTAVQAGLADRFGALSVFGHAGYRFLGDPPKVCASPSATGQASPTTGARRRLRGPRTPTSWCPSARSTWASSGWGLTPCSGSPTAAPTSERAFS
jgi:hypothetical protein